VLNQESLKAVQKGAIGEFQKPLYSDYAFSCLPGTIEKLLTGSGSHCFSDAAVGGKWGPYDVVVFFLIDGFGFEFFQAYQDRCPVLKRLSQEGILSQITSSFPSTTAAHLTALHTGLDSCQTGIYEWFQYEPQLDRMIAPILFSYAGDSKGDGLLGKIAPSSLFPFETVYQKWKKQGIHSIALLQEKISKSAYSKQMLSGAEILGFQTWKEGVERAAMLAAQGRDEPTYIFVYWGEIDSIGHRQGITSAAFEDAVCRCFEEIERSFLDFKFPKKIATLFSADHGMVKVDPKKTLFLNQICPSLEGMIAVNREGEPLIPAGSCRDFFLHIRQDRLQEAEALLSKALFGKAEVKLTKDLIEQGYFGRSASSQRLTDRIGNLVVLPFVRENVFWHFHGHRFEQHFLGAHGGMTPQEMCSFLLCLA
jgi:hypothetical protein